MRLCDLQSEIVSIIESRYLGVDIIRDGETTECRSAPRAQSTFPETNAAFSTCPSSLMGSLAVERPVALVR